MFLIVLCCIVIVRKASWKISSFLMLCFSLAFVLVHPVCDGHSRRAYEAKKVGRHRRPRCNPRYNICEIHQNNSFQCALHPGNPSKVTLVKVTSTLNRKPIMHQCVKRNMCKSGRTSWQNSAVDQRQAMDLYLKSICKIVANMKHVLCATSEVFCHSISFVGGKIIRWSFWPKFVRYDRNVVFTAFSPYMHARCIFGILTSTIAHIMLMTLLSPHQFATVQVLSSRAVWRPIDEALCRCAFRPTGLPDILRSLKKCVVNWGRKLGVRWAQSRSKRRKVNKPFKKHFGFEFINEPGKNSLPRNCDERMKGFPKDMKRRIFRKGKHVRVLHILPNIFMEDEYFDYSTMKGKRNVDIQVRGVCHKTQKRLEKWQYLRIQGCKEPDVFFKAFKCRSMLCLCTIMGFWYLNFLFGIPIGQAKNPGPNPHVERSWDNEVDTSLLWIGCANPTQLLGKENCLEEWGSGIWTFAETSATDKAQLSIRNKANQIGHKVVFGNPVIPHHGGTEMRGRAGGVAIASDYPIRKYVYPSPVFVHDSTRFVDTIVQMGNTTSIYVSSLYGMAANSCAIPQTFTNDLFLQATERALSFKGPAVICGDFNIPLHKLDGWVILERAGWQDAAIVDSNKFDRNPQPTTNFGLRHSFILMNPAMTAAFYSCRTSAHYDFDSHPLLVAGFSIPTLKDPITQWVLPKSLDDFMFDTEQILKNAQDNCLKRQYAFDNALELGDTDQAARQFTLAFEETMKSSCVDCEGNSIFIPPGHFGRFKGKPFSPRNVSIPCIRPGRQGDFTPIMMQTNCSLKYHTRQQRRIHSLLNQIRAAKRNDTTAAWFACQNLWNSILCAHGFTKSFASWVVIHLGWFVPLQTPHEEYVDSLHEAFTAYHKKEIQEYYMTQTAKNKLKVAQDVSKGGAMVFRDVKDMPTPPLDAINWTESCRVAKTTWKKEGKRVIQTTDLPDFDVALPVNFQGQSRWITKIEGTIVTLDRNVTLKEAKNPCITQKRSSSRSKDMHRQLTNYWSGLWNRDNKVASDHWDNAKTFITCLGDCPSCDFKPLNPDMWRQSLKGVKKVTARGCDGFSTSDAYRIEGQLLVWLLRILEKIENGAKWPNFWCLSRIVVLGKGSQPKSPLDIRPITILSKIYRLWSRLRSLEVLQHISMLMPAQVSATAGGISADMLAAFTANQVESARCSNKELCGVIIDLIKCYNTIPWEPVLSLLDKIGIPQKYSTTLFRHLQDLQRSFDVHGSCSAPIKAVTGIAEGCAMSVAVMASLSLWCHKVIEYHHCDNTTICYADNWGINSVNPEELKIAFVTMASFIDSLKMKISPKKSWFWCLNPKHAKKLKGIKVGEDDIPIVKTAIDLGCDQNYSKLKRCFSQNQRIEKAKRVMKRIGKKKIPTKFRSVMTQAAGYGTMSYGIEQYHISHMHWKTIRSSTVASLRRNVACASPYLACLFENSPLDPQVKTIIRSLLFWRRFFMKFPDTRIDFCNRLAGDYKGHGPAINLRKSLYAIGWTALGQGWIAHTSGISFNWVNASKSYLRKILRQCWSFHVADRSQHRKDFDINSIDEFNIRNLLRNRTEKDKAILVAHCTGAAYTKNILSKFDITVDSKCPYCKTKDTREHRLLFCKNLHDTRKGKNNLIQWLGKRSIATRNLALMPIYEKDLLILFRHQKQWPEWTLPELQEQWCHMFCDGSAFMQDQPTCTLAGSAVILVEPYTDNYTVIAAQPIPGTDHTSYRGEAFAVYLLLQNISRPIIYSDCQAVVSQLQELVDAWQFDRKPKFQDHEDIWELIWKHVCRRPKSWIQIRKTKAHCNPNELYDVQLAWEAKANNFVDEHAKKSVREWFEVFPQMEKRYNSIITEKNMTKQLHDLILEQAKISMEKVIRRETSETVSVEINQQGTDRKPNPIFCEPYCMTIPDLPCKFGDIFMKRVESWARKLLWPTVSTGHISLLELYVDFTLYSKSLSPIPIGGCKGTKAQKYLLKDIDPSVMSIPQSLAQQNVIWVRFLRWAVTNGYIFWPYPIIKQSNCLTDLGYSLWTPALGTHPILTMGDKAYSVLRSLFRTPTGKRRNLNISYNGESTSIL